MAKRDVPANVEAERALLGSIILNPPSARRLITLLSDEHFHLVSHQSIIAAMRELLQRGAAPGIIELADEMDSAGTLEKSGGRAYLASLIDGVPVASVNSEDAYLAILTEKMAKRQAMQFALSFGCAAANGSGSDELAAALLSEHKELLALQRGGETRSGIDGRKALMEQLQAAWESGTPPETGYSSGIEPIDGFTGGFSPGEMVVIAARPSVGKSAMLGQIALHFMTRDLPVVFVTLETNERALHMRMLCQLARVSMFRARAGNLSNEERGRMVSADRALADAGPLYVCDLPSLSISKLQSIVCDACRRHGAKLAIVDYLQLVTASGDGQTERITRVSNGLQAIARQVGQESGAVLIVACQLSRAPGEDEPQLYHLRDSGAIEQDADTVVLLWRDRSERGKVRFKIAKQRNGPVGGGDLVFLPEFLVFESMHRDQET